MMWWSQFCIHIGCPEGLLDYDFTIRQNKVFLKNLARMFCTYISEVGRDGKPRHGEQIQGETAKRYLDAVVQAHALEEIDISFVSAVAARWRIGFENTVVASHGKRKKRHKAGITRSLMRDMFKALEILLPTNRRLLLVVKAAMMSAFANEMRRAEFLRKSGLFNPHQNLGRGNVTFYDKNWNEVAPFPTHLEELRNKGGWMLHHPPCLKNDPRGEFFGDSPTPFPLGPLAKEGAFIDYGFWQVELEMQDPITNVAERKRTPMFVDPRNGLQLTAYAFDVLAMAAIRMAYADRGVPLSTSEVKKMYGIHSFRIGGDNAHKKFGTPKEVRKDIGHWRSDAIEVYSRAELESMAHFVKGQDIDCELLQTQDVAMPLYPEARRQKEPGEYTVETNSIITDPDQSFEHIRLELVTKPQRLIGRKIRKLFAGRGWFEGEVVAYDKWFKIRYEDGDEEEVSRQELKRLLT